MPVNLRRYFIGEIVKEVKKQNGQDEKEERPLTEAEKGIYRGKLRQVQPERFREETNARWKSRDIRTMNFEGS